MSQVLISGGALSATVTTQGRNGWCGLSRLAHHDYPISWLLSPALTLEHYIGIPMDSPEYIEYEPCYSPRSLDNITSDGCTLRYGAKSCSKVDCSISYRMVPPHYVDVLVRAQTNRAEWPFKSLALFFATIVNAPIYTGVTFTGHDIGVDVKGGNPWIHFNGFASVIGKTVHPAGLNNPELPRPENPPPSYYYSDSSVRFDRAFFFGLVGQMVFAVLFPPSHREVVRFTVNPLAPAFGGPAWDFFWAIKDPTQSRVWELQLRVLWKPFRGPEDVLKEYESYISI